MRYFHWFTRNSIAPSRAAIALAALVILAACKQDPMGSAAPGTYRITDGACGEVVFVENLATDIATAIEVIEVRKAEQFGPDQVTLETYQLRVVDQNGVPPQAEFHAVRVVYTDTQFLAHSVVEVVTTDGDLFNLEWCPD